MEPPVGWADVATKHDLAQLETRLGAKIDAQLWKLIAANIGSMIGLVSLLLGAGAL